MTKRLKTALQWNLKWFLGSSGAVIASIFGAQTIADKGFGLTLSSTWSFFIGALVFILAIITRFIFILEEEIDRLIDRSAQATETADILKKDSEQKQQEIETFITKQPKYYDRSRGDYHIYGANILFLKDAFSYINAIRKEDKITVHSLSVSLIYLCERIKDAFEEGVQKKYAVSLKLFKKNSGDQVQITVFCSDAISRERRAFHYSKVSVLNQESCFIHSTRETPDPKFFFYLNNDVAKDTSYKSSYFDSYPLPIGTTFEEREHKWALPYRSELVVPICPILSKAMPFNKIEEVLGFLCIDCRETGGFHPNYDPGMIAGVSDGIYDMVSRLIKELDT